MIKFIKEGLDRIKSTKRYANEKNVGISWFTNTLTGIVIIFMVSSLITVFGITLLSKLYPKTIFPDFVGISILSMPFILTFLLTIQYVHYPIKMMILFNSMIQKLFMKFIDKLDMYLWKKTGKDSLASNFIVKHPRLVKLIIFTPLIISMIIRLIR